MNRPEIYKKSVDILYDAYFNDTLQHNNCYACAVGNLVAAACGFEFMMPELEWKGLNFPRWVDVHIVDEITRIQKIDLSEYEDDAKDQIDSTGYTWQETAKIELAFETAPKGNSEDDWMYNGLVAVLDCLAEIHEIESVESDKVRFTELHLTKQP